MLAERVPGLPAEAARAVLEHHERCDGSGYPLGKTAEKLGLPGQIVALADSLQAIRVDQFEHMGPNLANAVPFLQMNSTTHFYAVYQALHLVLKRGSLKPARFHMDKQPGSVAAAARERGRALSSVLPPLECVHALMPEFEFELGRLGRGVDRLTARVVQMIHTSGLLRQELMDWLRQLESATSAESLEELNTIELMQVELRWQLASLRRMLNEFLDREARSGAAQARLQASFASINDCLTRLGPEPLHP